MGEAKETGEILQKDIATGKLLLKP